MTENTASLDRRFGQVHQRLDSHEQSLALKERRIGALEQTAAAQEVVNGTFKEKLDRIQSGITWLIQLVVGGILAGVVAFVLAGGLNVGP